MPSEKAMYLAREAHCRYCSWIDPNDTHPAMKCLHDIEINAAALDDFAAEAVREERDEIMRRCDGYSTGKCSGHEDNPCCHKRTAAAIAEWIEARGSEAT